MIFAAGQRDAVREGKFLRAVFEMRRQRDDVAVKEDRFSIRGGFEAIRIAPAREPLQKFGIGEQQRGGVVRAFAVRLIDPLDKFPIPRREQFLLVRGADNEINKVVQRARFFAGARAQQKKLNGEAVSRWFLFVRLRFADDAQRRARRVEVQRRGRRKPVLQFADELQFLFGFFGARKTIVFRNNLQAAATSAANPGRWRNFSGCLRARGRCPWNRKVRGASRRKRRKSATKPCGARRICWRRCVATRSRF